MPIREYQAHDEKAGCPSCRRRFERFEALHAKPLTHCEHCGAPVRRLWSAPAVGRSESGFDHRAKNAGFHKLKKLGGGEYEKVY